MRTFRESVTPTERTVLESFHAVTEIRAVLDKWTGDDSGALANQIERIICGHTDTSADEGPREWTTKEGNCTTHSHRHTRAEHEQAWKSGQGNNQARARGSTCVVVPCIEKELALRMSALFHTRFAIESCCHWDGTTLSMYCGDAGSGWRHLHARVTDIPAIERGWDASLFVRRACEKAYK